MNNEAKLKALGLEKEVRYYYIRYGSRVNGKPSMGTATICVVHFLKPPAGIRGNVTGGYARGIAFCSPKDQFSRKKGRSIALGRAILAFEEQESSDEISTTTAAWVLLPPPGLKTRRGEGLFTYLLSEWLVTLTPYEKKLFRVEV